MGNPHFYEDWVIGKVYETGSRTITQSDMDHFGHVEGHRSPLHNDPEFAKETIWGALTVHGVLIIAMASGLMGRMQMFDGAALAFLGMTWKFLGPVMVGDTLRVRWWIKEKRPTSKPGRGVIVREIQVLNQNDAIVCTGDMTSLWSMRTPA